MDILLHTILFEPARWTPRRVARPLIELLPYIPVAEFPELEVYEPHLTTEDLCRELRQGFQSFRLKPVILSSYLNLHPEVTTETAFEEKIERIMRRVEFYGFAKIRIFPGQSMAPTDKAGIGVFISRVRRLAGKLPGIEILLETHDGSIADDPEVIAGVAAELADVNVGLLFQPTCFRDPESILEQFRIEMPFIRHLHLQNRSPDLSFATLREGIVPWPQILGELGDEIGATLEFVPKGICAAEDFDIQATIAQAQSEAAYVRGIPRPKPGGVGRKPDGAP